MNNRLLTIILFLLLFSVEICMSQQHDSRSLNGDNLFVTSTDKPLIQVYSSENAHNTIGEISGLLVNSQDKLVALSENSKLLLLDLEGKVLNSNFNISAQYLALDKDDNVYALVRHDIAEGNSSRNYSILKFSPDLQFLGSIILSEDAAKDLNDQRITAFYRGSQGEFAVSTSEYGKKIASNIFLISDSGKLLEKFKISNVGGELIVGVKNEEIIVTDTADVQFDFYNFQGELLRSIDLNSLGWISSQIVLGSATLTRFNSIVFANFHGSHVNEVSLDEELRRIDLVHENQLSYKIKSIQKTNAGQFVSLAEYHADGPGHNVVLTHDSEGYFQKHLSLQYQNGFPSESGNNSNGFDIQSFVPTKDGCFWTVGKGNLQKINPDGSLAKNINLSDVRSYNNFLRVSRSSDLILLSENHLYFISENGTISSSRDLSKYLDEHSVKSMELKSTGEILIALTPYEGYKGKVLEFSSKGKFKKVLISNIDHLFDLAVDNHGKIYLLVSGNFVDRYSPDGKHEFHYSNAEGSFLAVCNGIVITFDFQKDIIYFTDNQNTIVANLLISGIAPYCDDIAAGYDGRLYLASSGKIVALNNFDLYQTNSKTSLISGKLRYRGRKVKELLLPYYVFLEGKDGKGKRFSALTTVDQQGNYQFPGVPTNSQVQIWPASNYPELARYKNSYFSFRVPAGITKRNFDLLPFKSNTLIIRGRVTSKNGAPLSGAVVHNAVSSTTTDFSGFYSLPVSPDSNNLLSISHPAAKFSKKKRSVFVGNKDVSRVNFSAK